MQHSSYPRQRRTAVLSVLTSLMAACLMLGALVLPTPTAAAQTPDDTTAPSQPTNPRWTDRNGLLDESTSAGDSQVHGRWGASTDPRGAVTGYRIQLSSHPTFATTVVDRSTGSTAT